MLRFWLSVHLREPVLESGTCVRSLIKYQFVLLPSASIDPVAVVLAATAV
jgi:hypothetical protein